MPCTVGALCFRACSGVIITSEKEKEAKEEFIINGPIAKVLGKYKKYKLIEDFPRDFKGSIILLKNYIIYVYIF